MASDAFNTAAPRGPAGPSTDTLSARPKGTDKHGRYIKTEEDFRTASIQMTDGSRAQVRAGKIISVSALKL